MKISDRLIRLLAGEVTGNQARLVEMLRQQGVKTTQSTVSRALKKINAVKGVDANGRVVYSLPGRTARGMSEKRENGLFGSLVKKVLDNGHMIVVHTRPGTAPTVAKVIDDQAFDQIIGTVAGDDTILIVPADVKKTRRTAGEIISYLTGVGLF